MHAVDNSPDSAAGAAVLRPMAGFLADAPTEIDWLVDGLLPMGSLSLLIAKPKVGKSKLARCLASAVASDRGTYLGRKIKTGPVMYLALDEGVYTVSKHFRQIVTKPELMSVFCGLGFQLGNDPVFRVKQWIQIHNPMLVVIDTLFDMTPEVEDVNSYQPIREAMINLLSLAHSPIGPHVMVLTHANKGKGSRGDEALGSTALTGKAENNLSLKIKGDDRVLHAWGRDIEEVDDVVLRLDPETGWVDAAGSTAEIRQQELLGKMVDVIDQADGPVTLNYICRRVGKRRRQTVFDAMHHLTKRGDVEITGGTGRSHDPHLYIIR